MELRMYLLSSDEEGSVSKDTVETASSINADILKVGKYIAEMYDKQWYIGYILSHEEADVLIKFMVKKGDGEPTFSHEQKTDATFPFIMFLVKYQFRQFTAVMDDSIDIHLQLFS